VKGHPWTSNLYIEVLYIIIIINSAFAYSI